MHMLYEFHNLHVQSHGGHLREDTTVKQVLTLITIVSLLTLVTTDLWATDLIFEAPQHSFGTVIQGTTLTYSFKFRNAGKNTIAITRVGSSCGCTVAQVSPRIILPGKVGQLTASFDSSDFSGPVTKEVFVYTNNDNQPAYTLSLSGTVIEEFVATPAQLNLGSVKAGARFSTTLKLTNRGKVPVTITGMTASLPQATLTVGKNTLKPGESTKLTFSITPNSMGRFINGYLNISLAGLSKKDKSIPVFGVVQK